MIELCGDTENSIGGGAESCPGSLRWMDPSDERPLVETVGHHWATEGPFTEEGKGGVVLWQHPEFQGAEPRRRVPQGV